MWNSPAPIVPPLARERLEREVTALPAEALLCEQGGLCVFVARADQIPDTLTEIGRLREVTFRAASEGTGHALDLDVFDGWYEHLFCWHRPTRSVVGAYRLAGLDIAFDDEAEDFAGSIVQGADRCRGLALARRRIRQGAGRDT